MLSNVSWRQNHCNSQPLVQNLCDHVLENTFLICGRWRDVPVFRCPPTTSWSLQTTSDLFFCSGNMSLITHQISLGPCPSDNSTWMKPDSASPCQPSLVFLLSVNSFSRLRTAQARNLGIILTSPSSSSILGSRPNHANSVHPSPFLLGPLAQFCMPCPTQGTFNLLVFLISQKISEISKKKTRNPPPQMGKRYQ